MAPTECSERATVARWPPQRWALFRAEPPATTARRVPARDPPQPVNQALLNCWSDTFSGDPEPVWAYTPVVQVPHVPVPVLLVTGPVGVGKTSVASELSELFGKAGVHHALVDVDSLRWCYPRQADDPFRVQPARHNLAAIWPNFQAAGADHLVLVDVIESRAELSQIQTAVPGADICVVRLHASVETLVTRVQHRETGLARDRHLQRAEELAVHMDGNPVEDILVETDRRTVPAIASEIIARSGWLAPVYG
jgi:adenylylsulfate kinase-like enzyme